MEKSLNAFFRELHARTCACRVCQVVVGALAVTDTTRGMPGSAGPTPSTPEREAQGLMRAAIVVLIHRHATTTGDGVVDIPVDAVMYAIAHELNLAMRAFSLPGAQAVPVHVERIPAPTTTH